MIIKNYEYQKTLFVSDTKGVFFFVCINFDTKIIESFNSYSDNRNLNRIKKQGW